MKRSILRRIVICLWIVVLSFSLIVSVSAEAENSVNAELPASAEQGTDSASAELGSAGQSASDSENAAKSASAGERTASSAPLGTVIIGERSYVELKDVVMLPGDTDQTVAFTLSLYNGEANDLQFIDYWVRLRAKSGAEFTANLMPTDKDKNRVPPQTREDFAFYAKLNASVSLGELEFSFVRWDFSAPDFARVLGTISVPADYSFVTPAESARLVQADHVMMKVRVKKAFVGKNDSYYLPFVNIEMKNTGNRSAKLPEFHYAIRTADGLMYPLQASGLVKDTEIQPLVSKEGIFNGSIPAAVGSEGWQFVIAQSVNAGENNGSVLIPAAFFELPDAAQEEVSLGRDYDFSDKSGVYTARLDALYRLPWEDQDLLTASLTIANRGGAALPIPNFTGYFLLDDAVKVQAKAVLTDKVIGLQPGASTSVQITGKIPYTYAFDSVKLFLQEKEGAGDSAATLDLLQFNHHAAMTGLVDTPVGMPFRLTDVGRSADFSVRSVQTYTGNSSNIYAVQMEVVNREKRFTGIPKLVAHFQAADGTIFSANVSEVKNKVGPGSSALLNLWSPLPKSYATSGFKVIVGEGVTDGKLSEGEDKADSYVRAAGFALPTEAAEPQNDFKRIDIYPYTISLSRIGAQIINLISGSLQISFDYELDQNLLVQSSDEEQKLVVEMKDKSGDFAISEELALGKSNNSGFGGSGNALEFGAHTLKITKNDPELAYKLKNLTSYQFNVYLQFRTGYKKLLASKELRWFTYSD